MVSNLVLSCIFGVGVLAGGSGSSSGVDIAAISPVCGSWIISVIAATSPLVFSSLASCIFLMSGATRDP